VPTLLLATGFVEIEAGIFAWIDHDMSMLNRCTLMLDHALDPIRVKFMSPEDAEKHKILMARKAEMAEKKKQDREKVSDLKKRSEND